MKRQKKGFTLVELLVVIAIIGLLATIAFLSLNRARSKARDAKRISDIRQLQSALELYYNDQTTPAYPIATAALDTVDTVNTDFTMTMSAALITPTYIATIPTAPTPNDDPPTGAAVCSTVTVGTGSVGNAYRYRATTAQASTAGCGSGATCGSWYLMTFCLGGATGGVPAGCNVASPTGIVPVGAGTLASCI